MKPLASTLAFVFRPILILKDHPVLFRYKGVYLLTVGVIVAVAAILSLLVATFLYKSMFPAETADSYFMWKVAMLHLSSLVFSKLFHFFALGRTFLQNPLKHLSETAYYNQGGQVGVFIATIWLSFDTGIDFFACMDINVTAGCLALAIGRIGCYNYGCCHGRPTASPFATAYTNPDSKALRIFPELLNVPLVPTQLVSAAFGFTLFATMVWILTLSPKAGIISGYFIIVYNLFRYFIEKYRISVVNISGRSANMKLFRSVATFLVASGAVYLIAVVWEPSTRIAFVAHYSLGGFVLADVLTPQSIVLLLLVFAVYVVTWGVHYKKLGQHFEWKKA